MNTAGIESGLILIRLIQRSIDPVTKAPTVAVAKQLDLSRQ